MRCQTSIVLAAALVIAAAPRVLAQDSGRDRGRGEEQRRRPVVAATTTPFLVAGTPTIANDGRQFTAVVLTKTARVPAAWPLVIQASIMVGGDPLKGTLGAISCAPAIDGQRGLFTPLPQPPPVVVGDAVDVDAAPRPLLPNLHWAGTFTAGPIAPGMHTFTLVCVSATPFEMRGSAAINVSGTPAPRA